MGYACPVCSDPQADAGHLANHLAFTSILHDDGHERWLDEHAPGWNEMGERELAAIVSEAVEETDFPQIFDDTVGGLESGPDPDDSISERSGAPFEEEDERGHVNTHNRAHDHDHVHTDRRAIDTSGPTDDETQAVLEEARELTRRMLDDEEDSE